MAAQRLHYTIDTIAREAEDSVHPPVDEALDQELSGDLLHSSLQ
jgi:hypothetical protein